MAGYAEHKVVADGQVRWARQTHARRQYQVERDILVAVGHGKVRPQGQLCNGCHVVAPPGAQHGSHSAELVLAELAAAALRQIGLGLEDAAVAIHHHLIGARFQSQLALTPEQAQKIDPMIDQAMRRVEAIRKETASQVFANVSTLHEQVLTVLTPEQKAKFEELERERRDYLRQKFGPATNAP